jgi:hypothetical protein
MLSFETYAWTTCSNFSSRHSILVFESHTHGELRSVRAVLRRTSPACPLRYRLRQLVLLLWITPAAAISVSAMSIYLWQLRNCIFEDNLFVQMYYFCSDSAAHGRENLSLWCCGNTCTQRRGLCSSSSFYANPGVVVEGPLCESEIVPKFCLRK